MNITSVSKILAEGGEILAHISQREACSIKTVIDKSGNKLYWFDADWMAPDDRYLVTQLTRRDGSIIRGMYMLERLEDRPEPEAPASNAKGKK